MRGSKDPNKNVENEKNNNLDNNYKKLLSAMEKGTSGSKDPPESDENNNFDENFKKLLSAMV